MNSTKCYCFSLRESTVINKKLLDKYISQYYRLLYQEKEFVFLRSKNEEDVIIFRNGNIIFWNTNKDDIINKILFPFEELVLIEEINVIHSNEFTFSENSLKINTNNILNKIAFSYSLSCSVKLMKFEEKIEEISDFVLKTSSDLVENSIDKISTEEIRKNMGRLLHEKHRLNFTHKFIEDPEIIWNALGNDSTKFVFETSNREFEVQKRWNKLHRKVELIEDCFTFIINEKNVKNSDFLEKTIIILIGLEIIFNLIGLYFR